MKANVESMGSVFPELRTNFERKYKLKITSVMENLKQVLIENIADMLDSEDVQREEILNGIYDPIKREESELHIRMAKAALAEYMRTCVCKKTDSRENTLHIDSVVRCFSFRRLIVNMLPVFIVRFLAPKISTIDTIGDGIYYRLYDSKTTTGAGLLIRNENGL